MKTTRRLIKKGYHSSVQKISGKLERRAGWIGASTELIQTGIPDLVYVRLTNNQIVHAVNKIAPLIYNYPVTISRSSQQQAWEVIELRQPYAGTNLSSTKDHHTQHEYPSADTIWVDGAQFRPLLVLPYSGMIIKLFGGVVYQDGQNHVINNQEIDLTSYIPSGALWALIEIVDGVLVITSSTVYESKEALIPEVIPSGSGIRLCAIRLYEGQESIQRNNSANDFVDLRWDNSPAADTVRLDRIGQTVDHDVQYMQNVVHSAGWISGGAIIDNGDGTIDAAAGIGLIRATDDNTSQLYFVDWEAAAGLALTDDSHNWVYVDYNSGSPQIITDTAQPAENNTVIILGLIYRTGTDLHINYGYRHSVGDHAGIMMEAMSETMPFAHASGGAVAETGTLQFTISQGNWWWGLTRIVTPSFNGASETFNYYYRDGVGGWTENSGQTAVDDNHYDDGSGTLGNVTSNRYSAHWGFLGVDGDVHLVYGRGNYSNLAAVQAANLPEDLPPELLADSRFLFKIIVQEGETSFESIESALTTRFAVTAGSSGAVDSVNGQTGTVVLDADDIDDTSTAHKFATAAQLTQITTNQTDLAAKKSIQLTYTHGANASVPASSTRYLGFEDLVSGLQTAVYNIDLPVNCSIRNLYVNTNSSQPATGTLVFTILKNGSASAIVVTVPAGGAAGQRSDVTNEVSITAGDSITLRIVNNATSPSALIIRCSMQIRIPLV